MCLFLLYSLICSLQHCDHLLGKGLSLGTFLGDVFFCFVTFSYGVLGQMCCLILSIPDLFLVPYIAVCRCGFFLSYLLRF